MHNCVNVFTVSRTLSVFLACLIAVPLPAQTPAAPTQINIVILEGEGAVNVVRQRVARESIVQVNDENHKPVAGVAVTFFLPNDGASGVFSNGSRSITVLTDAEGKAKISGLHANRVAGKMEIRVQASYQGHAANAVINQVNMLGTTVGAAGAGGISGKLLAILLIGAAGAAAGGVVAANSGGKSSSTTVTTTSVSVGSPTVGAPGK